MSAKQEGEKMRIISGERRGLQLKSSSGTGTRPTSDKVKESVFNMIGPYFDGGRVLDLFAGSGGLALEALSRGMDHAVLIEKDRRAQAAILENVAKCRYDDRVELIRADARQAVRRIISNGEPFDMVFLDPPYARDTYYKLAGELAESGLVGSGGTIVCEHDRSVTLPDSFGDFRKDKESVYGGTVISIYRHVAGEGETNG
ncbi:MULTISPECIES: 16S rRNA (guanine(966)-N(2))-methyltransferase RsmD [Bhargavaea]|uniref:16S rRNA (Guanine(966)-N(2))-methyltransferase RsmD n=1 Tax=Bhargavaea changchunensis TaxID=2134037 RepID=A0ABW2N9H3_9BACL|nr:16S rRNA (guanine(966)-N(2))-methyltransferase RsmD [Bhargavaea sp. CC-171006]